jgi:hypothetical protein
LAAASDRAGEACLLAHSVLPAWGISPVRGRESTINKPKLIYTLEITLIDGYMTDEFIAANPVVSRTIEIGYSQSLNRLHQAIFNAFDRWDDCHLAELNLGTGVDDRDGRRYVLPFIFYDPDSYGEERPATGSITGTKMCSLGLLTGRVFWYWYDLGDNWQHRIKVIARGEAELGQQYPRVVAQVGESPPQYPPLDEEEWEEEDQGSFSENLLAEFPGPCGDVSNN